jgi:hypothetical protein
VRCLPTPMWVPIENARCQEGRAYHSYVRLHRTFSLFLEHGLNSTFHRLQNSFYTTERAYFGRCGMKVGTGITKYVDFTRVLVKFIGGFFLQGTQNKTYTELLKCSTQCEA